MNISAKIQPMAHTSLENSPEKCEFPHITSGEEYQ